MKTASYIALIHLMIAIQLGWLPLGVSVANAQTTPTGTTITVQGETGTGGTIMFRSQALGARTRLLKTGQTSSHSVTLPQTGQYAISLRQSNDNYGPLEKIQLHLDGQSIGEFVSVDTGNGGAGWNVFATVGPLPPTSLTAGSHTFTLTVSGGDGYGVEIDAVFFNLTR